MFHTTNGHGPASAVRVLSGRGIVHRQLNKRQRAVIAANLVDGLIRLQPSVVQAAAMLRVSPVYVHLALKLSAEKRAAIEAGRDATSFVQFFYRPRRRQAPITDEILTGLACLVGSDRWLDAGARAGL